MAILESMLISSLLPAVVDIGKNLLGAATNKWIGMSVDEQIKLQNADVEKLKAIAELDNPHGTPSQWVVDLRASFRYIGAGISILAGGAIAVLGIDANNVAVLDAGLQLVAIPFSFIFGERLYLGLKGGLKAK